MRIEELSRHIQGRLRNSGTQEPVFCYVCAPVKQAVLEKIAAVEKLRLIEMETGIDWERALFKHWTGNTTIALVSCINAGSYDAAKLLVRKIAQKKQSKKHETLVIVVISFEENETRRKEFTELGCNAFASESYAMQTIDFLLKDIEQPVPPKKAETATPDPFTEFEKMLKDSGKAADVAPVPATPAALSPPQNPIEKSKPPGPEYKSAFDIKLDLCERLLGDEPQLETQEWFLDAARTYLGAMTTALWMILPERNGFQPKNPRLIATANAEASKQDAPPALDARLVESFWKNRGQGATGRISEILGDQELHLVPVISRKQSNSGSLVGIMSISFKAAAASRAAARTLLDAIASDAAMLVED